MIILKTEKQIQQIRKNGKILREAVDLAVSLIIPGKTTTFDLDKIIEKYILDNQGTPTFKGYDKTSNRPKFPASACISIGNTLVHGIPNKNQIINDGDLISIDVGVTKNQCIADSCVSYGIGNIKQEHMELLEASKEITLYGISLLQPGIRIYDLATVIAIKAEQLGFITVSGLYGHGTGSEILHEKPVVTFTKPPYSEPIPNIRLQKDMTITIEPVIAFKSSKGKYIECPDRWTLITSDGSWSSQFEQTVLITDNGYDILTPPFPEKIILK